MSDLISYLDGIDRKLAATHKYRRRASVARIFAPQTAANIIAGLDQRFDDLWRERDRTMRLIWVDPVLRQTMKEREKTAIAEAHRRAMEKEIRPVLPERLYAASETVKAVAVKVVGLEHEERKRLQHFDEAQRYYGSGAWQADGIDISKLDTLLNQLRVAHESVRDARAGIQDGLFWQVSQEKRRDKQAVTLLVENVLQQARVEVKPLDLSPLTPLAAFVQKERKPLEPDRGRGPKKVQGR
ncbi:MAG: hypothetical protein JSR99_03335 [Proteobacteria bacterium]|nr:hypothetical protein [Pseudomonadota bacterium]